MRLKIEQGPTAHILTNGEWELLFDIYYGSNDEVITQFLKDLQAQGNIGLQFPTKPDRTQASADIRRINTLLKDTGFWLHKVSGTGLVSKTKGPPLYRVFRVRK